MFITYIIALSLIKLITLLLFLFNSLFRVLMIFFQFPHPLGRPGQAILVHLMLEQGLQVGEDTRVPYS